MVAPRRALETEATTLFCVLFSSVWSMLLSQRFESNVVMPFSEEIIRLQELKERGAINESEFSALKAKLIAEQPPAILKDLPSRGWLMATSPVWGVLFAGPLYYITFGFDQESDRLDSLRVALCWAPLGVVLILNDIRRLRRYGINLRKCYGIDMRRTGVFARIVSSMSFILSIFIQIFVIGLIRHMFIRGWQLVKILGISRVRAFAPAVTYTILGVSSLIIALSLK